jgi:hypothetical protein
MALKATALARKKPRNLGQIFTAGLPRFVSNKANATCAISLNRSQFAAASVQSAHEKTKQGLCCDVFFSFCKIFRS